MPAIPLDMRHTSLGRQPGDGARPATRHRRHFIRALINLEESSVSHKLTPQPQRRSSRTCTCPSVCSPGILLLIDVHVIHIQVLFRRGRRPRRHAVRYRSCHY
ncbi:uncharacterized protein LOC123503795 [Portunus trituberculatus]|uniref:uncharacterized protein LOC123503795 n=1 Tax=Portunus trituberculatus TaxID=210409 RepID=UPI001E1D1F2D|nr:uncharacterized protein LOC123503795 [Portunus trituberculatus]